MVRSRVGSGYRGCKAHDQKFDIFGKNLEIMSERKLGASLYDFVLKEQRQTINENVEEKLIRQHLRLIKSKRGEDKDAWEVGPTFMITTSAAVRGVCMVEGDRERERDKA